MGVTIFHNPNCGTSCRALAPIRDSGTEPQVVEYLKTPLGRDDLVALIERMAIAPRELLRQRGTPYDELGLGDAKWRDDELIDCMVTQPILIDRPIVASDAGARLCRPPETVLDLLP